MSQSNRQSTLKVEGEIEGGAIEELANSWRNAISSGAKNVVVDFSGVIHIDRIARRLLKSMHNSGVRFTGARLAIQDVLDELNLPEALDRNVS